MQKEINVRGKLVPGLSRTITHKVEKIYLASSIGSGLVNVFSTAMMIAFMEEAAVEAVQPYLPAGFTTVGVHVDVSHISATPQGMEVTCSATLEEISSDGRKMTFTVQASDALGKIGFGIHKRVMINWEEFEKNTSKKLNPD